MPSGNVSNSPAFKGSSAFVVIASRKRPLPSSYVRRLLELRTLKERPERSRSNPANERRTASQDKENADPDDTDEEPDGTFHQRSNGSASCSADCASKAESSLHV